MFKDHCVRILSKNEIRECDKEELREKEKTHKTIMDNKEKEGYELGKNMYLEVLDNLKKKDKGMLKFLNKAGDKYKEAVYWYMWRVIRDEEIPEVC